VGVCKEGNDHQAFKGNPPESIWKFPMERGVVLDAWPYFKHAFDDGEV
jgi:hypothetical protein